MKIQELVDKLQFAQTLGVEDVKLYEPGRDEYSGYIREFDIAGDDKSGGKIILIKKNID